MSPKAGQTAGPNGLKFLWTLIGGRFFFQIFFFTGNAGLFSYLVTYIEISLELGIVEQLLGSNDDFK